MRDSGYLLGLMGTVVGDQDWGISAAANDGERVAVKNGWLSGSNDDGRWIINSIGRLTDVDTDLTIAVMSRGNDSFDAGVKLVETVSTLVRPIVAG